MIYLYPVKSKTKQSSGIYNYINNIPCPYIAYLCNNDRIRNAHRVINSNKTEYQREHAAVCEKSSTFSPYRVHNFNTAKKNFYPIKNSTFFLPIPNSQNF